MRNSLLISALIVTLTACSSKTAEIEQLEKEVFVIHDEVMPKMSDIMALQKSISGEIATLDSLLKTKANDSLEKRKITALELSTALKTADEGMMNWMHAYNGDSIKALDAEMALKVLQVEKDKIAAVKTQMLESIAKAEAFLKK
ncbi:MAG: viral A-type inclusion protein [Spirosomaceae bacterium]|jgi:hypothetical protein|nr:viral A-type inclusion protein [Spirosomataceae bacterium]